MKNGIQEYNLSALSMLVYKLALYAVYQNSNTYGVCSPMNSAPREKQQYKTHYHSLFDL